jgi:hypothetical protein
MRTFLVVDKLQMKPGIYTFGVTSYKNMYMWNIYMPADWFDIWFYHTKIKKYFKWKEYADFVKMDLTEIWSNRFQCKTIFSLNAIIYFTNSITFNGVTNELNENITSQYNHKLFEGCFNSQEQFESIFPSNQFSEFIIMPKDLVSYYFKDTKHIQYGLNVELDGCEALVPYEYYK